MKIRLLFSCLLSMAITWAAIALIDSVVFELGDFVALLWNVSIYELYLRSLVVIAVVLMTALVIVAMAHRQKAKDKIRAVSQQLKSREELLHAAHEQLRADFLQLEAANQQLRASEQNLTALNIELESHEQALAESEQRFRFFVQHTPVTVAMFDTEMRCLLYSHRFCGDFHLGQRDLNGQYLCDILPSGAPLWRDAFQRCLAGEVQVCSEDFFSHVDGSTDWIHWELHPWKNESGTIGGVILFVEIITDRKRMADTLRESEATLQSLFRAVPTGIGVVVNRLFIQVNDKICRMTGYAAADLLGKSSAMLYPTGADFDFVGRESDIQIRDQGACTLETRWKRTNGEIFDVLLSITPIEPGTRSTGLIFTALDITERKRMEKTLRGNEEHYRLAAHTTGQLIYDYDIPSGRIAWVGHIEATTGFSPDEFQKVDITAWEEMIHPEDRAHALAELERTMREGIPYHVEYRFRRKDGSYVYMEDNGGFLKNDQGSSERMIGAMKDISERKQSENALQTIREDESRFQDKLKVLHEIRNILGQQPSVQMLCRAAVELGRQRLGFDRLSIWFSTDDPLTVKGMYGVDEQGNLRDERESVLKLKSESIMGQVLEGKSRVVVSSDVPLFNNRGERIGKGTQVVAAIWDGHRVIGCMPIDNLLTGTPVSDRQIELMELYATTVGHLYSLKQAEEVLHFSRFALEHMGEAIFLVEENGRVRYVNEAACRCLNYTRDELLAMSVQDFDPNYPVHRWKEHWEQLRQQHILIVESVHRTKDGRLLPVEIMANYMEYQGQEYNCGIIRDISEQKRAAQSLQESEQKFRMLTETTSSGIGIFQNDVFVYINAAAEAISGYSRDEFKTLRYWEVVHPRYQQQVREQEAARQRGESVSPRNEFVMLTKDGKERYLDAISTAANWEGRPAVMLTFVDITERKQAEATVQESETRYKRLVQSVTDYIYSVKVENGRAISTTHGAACIAVTGYSSEDFDKNPDLWYQMVHSDDRPAVLEQARQLISGQAVKPLEHRIIHKNGSVRWVKNTPVLHVDDHNRVISYDGLVSDITERRNAEEALRESEEKYRMITEQSLVGIYMVKDRKMIFANEGLARIIEYPCQDILSWEFRKFMNVVHPSDWKLFLNHTEQIETGGGDLRNLTFDCRLLARGGETKWVLINTRSIHFSSGTALLTMMVDITDRKKIEQALAAVNHQLKLRSDELHNANEQLFAVIEQLKASEKDLMGANIEKEILLKEIHHRVKNNLQVISSLLKLQMGYIKDRDAVNLIRECLSRIKSIAIVHEKMYQSLNVAEVNIGDYARSLMDHLLRMYLVNPDAIQVQVMAEDVTLTLDQAIPCCLIINELVSNSLKYAFPPAASQGVIGVDLQDDGNGMMKLMVRDNGKGFPADIDFRNTNSLGLQLVMTFVDQLKGRIEMDRREGTVFTVTFPREKTVAKPDASRPEGS